MPNKKNERMPLPAYGKESLEPKYIELFDRILLTATHSSNRNEEAPVLYVTDKDGKEKPLFDKGIFYEFVNRIPKRHTETFYAYLDSHGIKKDAWRKTPENGLGTQKKAEMAFCFAAQVNKIPLKHFLAAYIRSCQEDGANLLALKGYEDQANELLEECYGQKRKIETPSAFAFQIEQFIEAAEYERREIFQAIDDFLTDVDNDRGFILIEGGAGAGKSSILANATRDFQEFGTFCVYHFNSILYGKNSTFDLIQSLYDQLSLKYDVSCFEKECKRIQETGKGYKSFVSDILFHVSGTELNNSRIFVIVDALDEIDPNDPADGTGPENTQTIPARLPKNVFFLISSRSFDKETYYDHQLRIDLSDVTSKDSYQRRDIENFIRQKADSDQTIQTWIKRQNWDQEFFVETLRAKSEYAFIYLYYVFRDIANFDADSFPQGLEQYYNKEYKRLLSRDAGDEQEKKLILAAISKFPPDISINAVAAFSHLDLMAVNRVAEDWYKVRLIHKVEVAKQLFVKFFHLSFYDFLTDTDRYSAARELSFFRDLQAANQALADFLCKLIDFSIDTLTFSESLPERRKIELFRIIFEVLASACDADSLSQLLTHKGFCKEVIKRDPRYGQNTIINHLAVTYGLYESRNENDKADRMLKAFFQNITPRTNPIIARDDVSSKLANQISTFADAYQELVSQDRKQS